MTEQRTTPPPIEEYRALIESALAHGWGTHNFEDVVNDCARGMLQFWPGPHSVIVTEVITYPRFKALRIFLAAGTQAELEAMSPPIIEWGREQDCTRMEIMGRKGWARSFLARSGWDTSSEQVGYTREL